MPAEYTTVCVPPGIDRIASVFCGCGATGEAWASVRQELVRIKAAARISPADQTGLWHIMAYLLDHLKLTEHGASIPFAWLTDDGKATLEFLQAHGDEWHLSKEIEFVNAEGVVLGGAPLNN